MPPRCGVLSKTLLVMTTTIMLVSVADCARGGNKKDSGVLRYSNNSVSGFVVRDSITREREEFEGDIEGMVGAIAQHVLQNLAAQHGGGESNKNKWTFQMDDGEGGHTIWTEEGLDLNSFFGEEEAEAEAEAEPEPAEVAMVSAVAEPIRVFIPDSPNVQQATRKVLKRRPTQQASQKWRPAPTWTPLSTSPPSVFPHVYPSVAKPPPRNQVDAVHGTSSSNFWSHSPTSSSEQEQTTSASSYRPTIVVAPPPPPSATVQYEYDQFVLPTRRPQLTGAIGPTYKPTIGPGRITTAPNRPYYRPTMASVAVTTTTPKVSPPVSATPWYVRGAASYQTTVKPVDLVKLATAAAQVITIATTTTTTTTTTAAAVASTASGSSALESPSSTPATSRPAQPGDPMDLSTYVTNQFVYWRDYFNSWSEFFNGGGKKSDSGVLALAVFGIPLATAILTFLGFGPLAVVIVAWSVPIASVLILPEAVTGQSSELARTLVGRALGMLFSQ